MSLPAYTRSFLYSLIKINVQIYISVWEFNGFHKAGGIAQSTLPASDMTLPVCLRLCRLDASCQGIDFDETGTTRCWIHRADTICTALLRRNNIMHYRLRQIVCTTTAQNDTLLGMHLNVGIACLFVGLV